MEKQNSTLSMIDETEKTDLFDNPEPWSKYETKLVLYSFVSAIVLLVIFGFLVNKYLLDAF